MNNLRASIGHHVDSIRESFQELDIVGGGIDIRVASVVTLYHVIMHKSAGIHMSRI